jgi:hypothetical protein
MRRLVWLLAFVVLIGGSAVGGRYWIAQDKSRCAMVPDYLQAVLCTPDVIASLAFKKGEFVGSLDVRFMSLKSGDGYAVEMVQLLKPFSYKDSAGVVWDVPEGFISDGASIPENLWVVVGGPYSGPYRDAAVIHDYFCYTKKRKWEDVHNVFLEAALNRGTPEWKAQYMYAGILFKGPRWPAPRTTMLPTGLIPAGFIYAQTGPTPATPAAPPPTAAGKTDKQIFDELQKWIETAKPSRDEIRKRVDELRKTQTPTKMRAPVEPAQTSRSIPI